MPNNCARSWQPNIAAGRIQSGFGGGVGDTYYAITGGNAVQAGLRQTSIGNNNLKWEENKSTNVGVDVYQRNTDNLLITTNVPEPSAGAIVSGLIAMMFGRRRRTARDL